MFQVYVVFHYFVSGGQHQCNLLPGMTVFRNDLLYVEWDVIPY